MVTYYAVVQSRPFDLSEPMNLCISRSFQVPQGQVRQRYLGTWVHFCQVFPFGVLQFRNKKVGTNSKTKDAQLGSGSEMNSILKASHEKTWHRLQRKRKHAPPSDAPPSHGIRGAGGSAGHRSPPRLGRLLLDGGALRQVEAGRKPKSRLVNFKTQLPSGASFVFFWGGRLPFKLNQQKKRMPLFSPGHLASEKRHHPKEGTLKQKHTPDAGCLILFVFSFLRGRYGCHGNLESMLQP